MRKDDKDVYHVADPEFWRKMSKRFMFAMVQTPSLGDQMLSIYDPKKPELIFVLTGGTVMAVEIIAERPRVLVKIGLTNAPRPLVCVLPNGYEPFGEGPQDHLQFYMEGGQMPHGGELLVVLDYHWCTSPHTVGIQVFHEKPRVDGGYRKDHVQGLVTLARLRKIMERRQVPVDSKTKRIALPVKWIDASGQEESRESLLLPAQVTPKIFLKAAARLCHFASFVVK